MIEPHTILEWKGLKESYMEWMRLPDGRSVLPPETILEFSDEGGRFRITGEPVGFGGSGILYPAVRLRHTQEGWKDEEMRIVLKECYPLIRGNHLLREDSGRIKGEVSPFYSYAKEMMRREKTVTGQIYNRGFRLVPVWAVMEKERISLDGKTFSQADNLYSIMERLDEKGTSLGHLLIQNKDRLTAYQSICVVNQVLRSLGEVHENGFLHGDIQENNIFMKGSDALKGELGEASLIDFGSARPLLEDGTTEPISDRNLYTTSGYTAPECIRRNDGTLRLTRAADLYSAGYLALRLFTGKALDSRALGLVVNGKYFYERQAKKIACPSGCVEYVNKILEKALQEDPDSRYQTAEEMLEDTLRLERALAPKKSAVAAADYAAFISYCHQETVLRAAEQVQKRIERYRIPKSVRPADGRKRLGRVFRDLEELSSSSDMELHLQEALAHSEYLILLLSPDVPSSPWVKREIELFLKNHDREHILTMIVEGEPEEVFPEILRQDEKYDGRIMKQQNLESLAADIRGATEKERNKKLKTEIYRLLAPMLGCNYDDLRQRQKEYRMRRLIQTMTAAVIFLGITAGYIGWQAYQIHANYWETLIRQSRYLAQTASGLLAQGDRTKALSVALEALPKGDKDTSRPRVAEAEAALAQSLYCWQAKSTGSDYLNADRKLSMDSPSAGMEQVSQDGSYLLAADTDSTVYLWELASGNCIRKWDTDFWNSQGVGGSVLCCSFLNNTEVLAVTESCIASADITDQTVRMICELEAPLSQEDAVCALSPDGTLLAVYDLCLEAAYSKDAADLSLRIIRTSDGETAEVIPIASELSDVIYSSVLHGENMAFSPDSRYLVFPLYYSGSEADVQRGALLLADLKNLSWEIIKDEQMPCQKVCFLENGETAVFGCQEDPLSSLYETTAKGKISLYDPHSGQCVWQKNLLCQMREGDAAGLLALTAEIDGKERQTILLWYGRSLILLDRDRGDELWRLTCEEEIAGVQPLDNGCIVGTSSGSLFQMDPASQSFEHLGTNVKKNTSGFLFHESSETAILLSLEEGTAVLLKRITDEPEETIKPTPAPSQVSVSENGLYYAVYAKKEDLSGEITFYRIDDHGKEAVQKAEHEICQPGQWISILREDGKPADGDEIFCYIEDVSGQGRITAYDVPQQKILWQRQTVYGPSQIQFCHTSEGQDLALLYPESSIVSKEAQIIDLRTGQTLWRIPLTDGLSETDPLYSLEMKLSASGRYLLALFLPLSFTEENEAVRLRIYDIEQECWLALPEEFSESALSPSYTDEILWMAPQEDLAAVYLEKRNQLCILDLTKMKILQYIPFYGSSQRQAVFLPGESSLLLWGDDGLLKLWDMEEECILMEDTQKLYDVNGISLDEGSNFIEIHGTDEANREFFYEDSVWFYLWEAEGRFYPYTRLKNGFYVSNTDQICCIGTEGQICWYDHYTLDELLEKARKIVGEEELTRAEKNKYFISTEE